MDELIQNLGIDPKAIIVQTVGFLIVLVILWKFAFGKIGGVIENRRNEIANRMAKLESEQKELERLQSETQQRLDEIEAESQAKIQVAIEEANAEREKILEQTRQDSEQILQRAEEEIQREKEIVMMELRSIVADLAIEAVGKIFDVALDEEQHRKLVDDFITQLPASEASAQDA